MVIPNVLNMSLQGHYATCTNRLLLKMSHGGMFLNPISIPASSLLQSVSTTWRISLWIIVSLSSHAAVSKPKMTEQHTRKSDNLLEHTTKL